MSLTIPRPWELWVRPSWRPADNVTTPPARSGAHGRIKMTYASLEHFRDVTSRNVLALQEAREKGRKVVGQFCIYSPLEIALAAGAVPVSLCGTK